MLAPIGKYTVEKVLGEGGFGVVYLGFDSDVGQPVAIKKLRAAGDPDLLKRFQMEIRTTASLRHKNIVTIHASGEDAGDPYLVMEFLAGSTLKQIIRERRPLTLLEKVRIMTQVAEGLAYANAKGVVHRDVKPENIMLLPDDTVKIMDFGIALGPNRNTAVTQTGGIIGTPPYFAPEQIEGLKATEQTDIFSFGDVYYELLTGSHPFEQSKGDWRALQMAILSLEPRSIGELVPGCPESLELLVHRTLAKSPEFRYQSFEEVQLDSEAILVDLRHEGAAAILREVRQLMESSNLQTAQLKINKAYQLEPGNREVRRLREEINQKIQGEQVQARIGELLTDADRHIAEGRYAEAVQTLESGFKLDSHNVMIAARLKEAKGRLDNSHRANRLVSEARLKQQKGLLDEALQLFQAALVIEPEHTDARRLASRVENELERRRLNERLQQAIRSAREHLAAKRFAVASAILEETEREQPGTSAVGELRAEIQHGRAEEERRLRAERFNLALDRMREAIQSEDLENARPMLDLLFADFGTEPGAAEVLPALRQRLNTQIRAKEIAQYEQKARGLLREKSFPGALALLAEARGKFPDDAGLQRLDQSAKELFQANQRDEAVAAALQEAKAKRDAGDTQGALATLLEGQRRLGEDAAFVRLVRQLEMEIEQQRYSAGLERLLREGREMMAAGRHSEAIDRIQGAKEFAGEAEVRALLDAVQTAVEIDLERRFVEETLATADILQTRGSHTEALQTAERGLARYPLNASLSQAVERLRDRVELERRRSAVEKHRAAIRAEIERADWTRAGAALQKARAECPGDSAFDDLANQVEAGAFDAGLRELEARVRQNLAGNALSRAELDLDATRTMYARDPRWKMLAQEVVRRKEYETALNEAERRRNASRLSEAEQLLTEVINQGPPDKRADQMRDAIRMQRSETSRQAEIARIAKEIRDRLQDGDLAQATSELAVARARYPGESAWTDLQAEVDTRRQAHRRREEIAAAEENVRQLLGRDDVRQAVSVLLAARTKFPEEDRWTALEAEARARHAVLQRQQDIAAVEERVRALDRDIREAAVSEADAPAGAYPVAPVWDVLRNVTARLDQARAKYPGESVWDGFQAEVAGRQTRLEHDIRDIVRNCPGLAPLDWTARQLGAARTRHPGEPFWTVLQADIDGRREPLRLASIAQFEARIQECLQQNDFQTALSRLDAARKNHPGERRWDRFQAEIDAHQAQLHRQEDLAALDRSVHEQLERVGQIAEERDTGKTIERQCEAFQRAAAIVSEARAKYPDEDRLVRLQVELDTRRSLWQIEVTQAITNAIRSEPRRQTVQRFGPQIGVLRAIEPHEPSWARLKAEIDALEAQLQRQAEIAGAGERVRGWLERNSIQQAAAELNAARARYPNESRWATLEAQIDARRALEEQKRRVARERSRERLSVIARQMETEPSNRKRRTLAREAQEVAASYIDDAEITALAAGIQARVEVALAAAATTQKPIPWKAIGAGAGAAAVVVVLVIGLRRQPAEPAKPAAAAAIPFEIRTDPPGASVQVGDRSCVTPNCQLQLPPGSYPLNAQLPGYEPKQETVSVHASNRLVDLTLEPIRLPPPPPGASTGTLIVRAGVADALVYIDGIPQPGRTDQSGSVSLSLEAKAHQVRVERNQYETPAGKQIRVTAGAEQTITFRLVLQSARLELSGAPANLELRVDSKPLGRADGSASYSFPASVQPGEHTLEVTQGLLQAGQGSASPSITQRFEPGQRVRLAWKPNIAPPADIGQKAPAVAGTTAVKKQPTPEEIEEQAWEKVRETSNPAQLREFRNKYPGSSHEGEIQTALDRLVWSNTKKDSSESLTAYLQELPNGTHAPEAKSQLADLVWKGVDQSKTDQVRKFMEENPNNPHVRDAQKILDQFSAGQQAMRKQIIAALNLFNAALENNRASQLKAVWPSAPEAFLKPSPHTTYELQPTAEPVIAADQARVICSLTTVITQPRSRAQRAVTVELRNQNGQWLIEKIN